MFFLLISYIIIAHHVSFASSAGTTKRANTEAEEEAPTDKQSSESEQKASEEDSDEDSEEDSEGGSGEEDEEQGLEEEATEEVVLEEMAAMSLSSATATMKLPALVYTWSKDRQERVSVDILLLSGTTEDQIDCKIGKGGKSITVLPSVSFRLGV